MSLKQWQPSSNSFAMSFIFYSVLSSEDSKSYFFTTGIQSIFFTSKMVEAPILQHGSASSATIRKGTSSIILTPRSAEKFISGDRMRVLSVSNQNHAKVTTVKGEYRKHSNLFIFWELNRISASYSKHIQFIGKKNSNLFKFFISILYASKFSL